MTGGFEARAPSRAALIRAFILTRVEDHPRDIARVAAKHFKVSRQTIFRQIRALIALGLLEAKGNTRARTYDLRAVSTDSINLKITPELHEDQVWLKQVAPLMKGLPENVVEICQHGITEMLNNVIDHSGSQGAWIGVIYDAIKVTLYVADSGVGIFEKIQSEMNLLDPRHALLELSKGKLTTDPKKHTGEGIYFTSRAFDYFSISSGTLYFRRFKHGDQWMIEVEDRLHTPGTRIGMEISRFSRRRLEDVFRAAAGEAGDYAFSKTHIPIKLVRYGEEQLVSRSQAKRLLARFDRFQEVMLDFQGVKKIGQAFADEIFRVFREAHPTIAIRWAHTTPAIDRMIKRTMSKENAIQEKLL